jgi:ribulose-5-phosphate 4-epimerase/fuculose-1-phosphate aldolase
MMGAHIGEVPQYDDPAPVESSEAGCVLAEGLGNAKALLLRSHGAITVGRSVEEVCALAVMLEESARVQFMATLLGNPVVIEKEGREDVFAQVFAHFQEVFWQHHSQEPENTPYLSR